MRGFFVHTSLVLMLSLDRMPEHFQTLAFYIRRAFRIYPLSILCVVLVIAFKIPAVPMTGEGFQSPTLIVLFANLFLIQNIVGHSSVTTPMWSLPYEVEMYVVLPLLHKLAQSKRAIPYLASLIAFFSLLGWIVQQRTGHSNMLAFIPCFLSGILAYTLRDRRPFLPAALWPFLLIVWMFLGGLVPPDKSPLYLPLNWVSAIVLGVGVYYFHDSTHPGWNAASEWVAKYSYGIYLAHVPMMWVVFSVLPVFNLFVSTLLWLAGTAAVSMLAYHLLEEPMVKAGKKVSIWVASRNRELPVAVVQ